MAQSQSRKEKREVSRTISKMMAKIKAGETLKDSRLDYLLRGRIVQYEMDCMLMRNIKTI